MAEILGHRTGDRLAGKGGDRPRHRDRAGPDRRRRTRYRPVARADGASVDRGQPQRGRHLGQPLDPAIRPCAAPCLRRGSPDISAAGGGTAGRRYRRARRRGWHDLRTGQCQNQLLGARRGSLARSRCHAGRAAEGSDATRAGRQFDPAARHSRQGFWPNALHPRSRTGRECCTVACCARRMRARNSES